MNLRNGYIIGRWLFPTALLAALLVPAVAASAQEIEAPTAEAKAVEQAGSPGMQIPVDGASIEAFEESLEQIRAETTPAEFTSVQNALDYLLVYDLGARRNRELLYQRLDGKTPTEILQMVKWRQGGRSANHP